MYLGDYFCCDNIWTHHPSRSTIIYYKIIDNTEHIGPRREQV